MAKILLQYRTFTNPDTFINWQTDNDHFTIFNTHAAQMSDGSTGLMVVFGEEPKEEIPDIVGERIPADPNPNLN